MPVGEGEAEALVGHRVLGEPAVAVVAGEPGPLAQVLPPRAAEGALPAGPAQPGDAHPVACSEAAAVRDHLGRDLVPGHQRQLGLGQLTVEDVEVGAADPARAHAQENLAGAGLRSGTSPTRSEPRWASRIAALHPRHGRVRAVAVALVTGANRGIGHEVARQLAEKDYDVIVSARDEDKAAEAAEAVGGRPLALDVSDPREHRARRRADHRAGRAREQCGRGHRLGRGRSRAGLRGDPGSAGHQLLRRLPR